MDHHILPDVNDLAAVGRGTQRVPPDLHRQVIPFVDGLRLQQRTADSGVDDSLPNASIAALPC